VRSGGIGDPHPAGVPDEGAEVSDIVRGGQLVHPLGVAEVFVPRLVETFLEKHLTLVENGNTRSSAAVEQRAVGEAVNALAAPVHTDIQRNVVSARDGGLEAPPDVEGGRGGRVRTCDGTANAALKLVQPLTGGLLLQHASPDETRVCDTGPDDAGINPTDRSRREAPSRPDGSAQLGKAAFCPTDDVIKVLRPAQVMHPNCYSIRYRVGTIQRGSGGHSAVAPTPRSARSRRSRARLVPLPPPRRAAMSCNASSCSSGSMDEQRELFKTELCRYFEMGRPCPYSSSCKFAHGQCELQQRQRPRNYKTKQCRSFHGPSVLKSSRCSSRLPLLQLLALQLIWNWDGDGIEMGLSDARVFSLGKLRHSGGRQRHEAGAAAAAASAAGGRRDGRLPGKTANQLAWGSAEVMADRHHNCDWTLALVLLRRFLGPSTGSAVPQAARSEPTTPSSLQMNTRRLPNPLLCLASKLADKSRAHSYRKFYWEQTGPAAPDRLRMMRLQRQQLQLPEAVARLVDQPLTCLGGPLPPATLNSLASSDMTGGPVELTETAVAEADDATEPLADAVLRKLEKKHRNPELWPASIGGGELKDTSTTPEELTNTARLVSAASCNIGGIESAGVLAGAAAASS
uniref:C3H1-type domain-containing protein n=1 Tax=Macrostomum lignano TaxID=282301 RepID=A0A1I8IMC6_9PLAT